MRVADRPYEVEILGYDGQPVALTDGYFGLANGEPFSFRFKNETGKDCAAYVMVNGERVGGYGIPANGTISYDRPGDASTRFVFIAKNSEQAEGAGLADIERNDMGAVIVAIAPPKADFKTISFPTQLTERAGFEERTPSRLADSFSLGGGMMGLNSGLFDLPKTKGLNLDPPKNAATFKPGAVAYGGFSDQTFTEQPFDPDFSKATIFKFRLALDPNRVVPEGALILDQVVDLETAMTSVASNDMPAALDEDGGNGFEGVQPDHPELVN